MAEPNGETTEQKTYDEAAMQQAITDAKAEGEKTGQTTAHAHWQSVTDKAVAGLRKENTDALAEKDKAIAELRTAQLATMSPEERSTAILEDVQKMLAGQGANSASNKPQTVDNMPQNQGDNAQADRDDEAAKQAVTKIREEMGEHLSKTYGVDASKIDWADDAQGTDAVKRFTDSVFSQMKPGAKAPNEDDPNKVDTSNSNESHTTFDPKTTTPESLIQSGAGTVRRNPSGGFRESPFK